MDKATTKDRCLHYIGWHALAYGAPAGTEDVQGILEEHHNMSADDTMKLLDDLKDNDEISYWTGKFTEGWILPDNDD